MKLKLLINPFAIVNCFADGQNNLIKSISQYCGNLSNNSYFDERINQPFAPFAFICKCYLALGFQL